MDNASLYLDYHSRVSTLSHRINSPTYTPYEKIALLREQRLLLEQWRSNLAASQVNQLKLPSG